MMTCARVSVSKAMWWKSKLNLELEKNRNVAEYPIFISDVQQSLCNSVYSLNYNVTSEKTNILKKPIQTNIPRLII